MEHICGYTELTNGTELCHARFKQRSTLNVKSEYVTAGKTEVIGTKAIHTFIQEKVRKIEHPRLVTHWEMDRDTIGFIKRDSLHRAEFYDFVDQFYETCDGPLVASNFNSLVTFDQERRQFFRLAAQSLHHYTYLSQLKNELFFVDDRNNTIKTHNCRNDNDIDREMLQKNAEKKSSKNDANTTEAKKLAKQLHDVDVNTGIVVLVAGVLNENESETQKYKAFIAGYKVMFDDDDGNNETVMLEACCQIGIGLRPEDIAKLTEMVAVVEDKPENLLCQQKFAHQQLEWFEPNVCIQIKYHVPSWNEDGSIELLIPRFQSICDSEQQPYTKTKFEGDAIVLGMSDEGDGADEDDEDY